MNRSPLSHHKKTDRWPVFKKIILFFREPQTSLGQWVRQRDEFCYVCRHFKEKYPRYIDTFLQLVTGNAEFFQNFSKGKGFCLHHFGDIIEAAEKTLSNKEKEKFYSGSL